MSDNEVKFDGLVAEIISDREVVVNKGSQDGISVGEMFIVFCLGQEIHDPKTGESLGILEEIKGKGKVIHVQERMCTIQTYEFDSVKRPSNLFLFSEEENRIYRKFVDVNRGDYVRNIVG